MRYRLANQQLRLRSRTIDTKDRYKGCLARRRVGPHRLSGLRRGALDVEKIVGNLEGETQIMGIAAQRHSRLAGRLGENRSGLAGKSDQRAGLHPLETGDLADIQRLLFG